MRKYKLYLLIISSLMLFAGCSRQDSTDKLMVTVTPSPFAELELTATPEPTKEPKSDESEVASIPQPDNYMEMGLKEDWEYIEQAGIDESARINVQRDLSMFADYNALPICYCEAYEVLYYINYSDNKFIYRCKDNEIKTAVRIPADNLYLKDGELYFRVVGTYDDLRGVKEGDICKYSPTTGEIELLVADKGAEWMILSDKGIYYEPAGEWTLLPNGNRSRKNHVFCYEFEKGVSEEVKAHPRLVWWKDDYTVVEYISTKNESGLGLHKIGTNLLDNEPIILGGRYVKYCIQDDSLYCEGNGYFYVIQLETGEIREYDCINNHGFDSGSLGAFIVKDNKAYQSSLQFYLDLETGKVHNLSGEGGRHITRIFNVNNKIYALYYEKGYDTISPTGTPELMEVVFDEETFTDRNGEFLGYRFVSIGEE